MKQIIKTLKINAIFFILTVTGIFILGVIYTHMVCGPLVRVHLCSHSVADGKMNTKIKFRKKDAIHLNSLRENLNWARSMLKACEQLQ